MDLFTHWGKSQMWGQRQSCCFQTSASHNQGINRPKTREHTLCNKTYCHSGGCPLEVPFWEGHCFPRLLHDERGTQVHQEPKVHDVWRTILTVWCDPTCLHVWLGWWQRWWYDMIYDMNDIFIWTISTLCFFLFFFVPLSFSRSVVIENENWWYCDEGEGGGLQSLCPIHDECSWTGMWDIFYIATQEGLWILRRLLARLKQLRKSLSRQAKNLEYSTVLEQEFEWPVKAACTTTKTTTSADDHEQENYKAVSQKLSMELSTTLKQKESLESVLDESVQKSKRFLSSMSYETKLNELKKELKNLKKEVNALHTRLASKNARLKRKLAQSRYYGQKLSKYEQKYATCRDELAKMGGLHSAMSEENKNLHEKK